MIAIIDYGAGNTRSVVNALKRLGANAKVSSDPNVIQGAEKVIFPGVGHASSAIKALSQTALNELIPQLGHPVLGICLGMQLMCASSEETTLETFKLFPNRIKRFNANRKVPHMGWNSTLLQADNPLFKNMDSVQDFYYVHSYHAQEGVNSIAKCNYGGLSFCAGLHKDNFYALQFHPEKSGEAGAQILQNFIAL